MKNASWRRALVSGPASSAQLSSAAKNARPPVELCLGAKKRRDSAATGTNSNTTKSTTNCVKATTGHKPH